MAKPDDEASAESNRGKRLEYELLRNEILATDRMCYCARLSLDCDCNTCGYSVGAT